MELDLAHPDHVYPVLAQRSFFVHILGPLDSLVINLLPELRVLIGFNLLLVRGQHDRMPGRDSLEDLAIVHIEVVAHDGRTAYRDSAYALFHRILDDLDLKL